MSEAAAHPTRPWWLDRLGRTSPTALPDYFGAYPPPPAPRRRSAVLLLLGPTDAGGVGQDGVEGVDIVLTERSARLRSHAGQVSFPGGGIDAGDDGPVGAALRESEEEIGLVRDSVEVVTTLPWLYLAPSGNAVAPVVAWWPTPGPIGVVDADEVASVARVPLTDLLDPRHRFTVVSPAGYEAPGFEAGGVFVWGFTAMLLEGLFDAAGVNRPWDRTRRRGIPRGMAPSARDIASYLAAGVTDR